MSLDVLSILTTAATRTGGPPPFVGGSAIELSRLGAHMRVLSTDLSLAPTGWLQRQGRVGSGEIHPTLSGIDLQLYPARFPRRLAFSPALGRALPNEIRRADIVHLHNLWQYPQYAGFRAARRAGVPYIVSPHGGLDPYLRRHGRLRKWLTSRAWQDEMLEGAAMIHVTTEAERELVADVAPDVPRSIVPPGIYVAEFAHLPPREAVRERFLGGFDGPVVVFLGRLTYKKGLDILVRAFREARKTVDARLVVVGPDDEGLQPGLRRLAAELGVAAEVCFTGPLYGEDRLAALSAADVWALSSHAENFGIAVVEAMAAGCPVVISPFVNIADEIHDAGAGVVADLDPATFGAALADVLAEGTKREQLIKGGHAFAARYDWHEVGPQMREMYASALAMG